MVCGSTFRIHQHCVYWPIMSTLFMLRYLSVGDKMEVVTSRSKFRTFYAEQWYSFISVTSINALLADRANEVCLLCNIYCHYKLPGVW